MSSEKKKKKKKQDVSYAHNPHYCMIRPDTREQSGDDVASTGQS